MIANCLICGKEFKIRPAIVRRGQGKMCSTKCSGVWISRNKSGDNAPRWEGGKVTTQCKYCGKEIGVYKNKLDNKKGIFCSHKCYWNWLEKNSRGDRGNGWKGGISPINRLLRHHSIYINWRNKVFERDGFTCVKCGATGCYLHAHHIKPFSVIVNSVRDKYPLLPLTEMVETNNDFLDTNNGATLCKKCHKKEHKRR